MGYESLRAKEVGDEIRFTQYRLQVARELPDGSFREAMIEGIAARLAALSRTLHDCASGTGQDYSGARV